MRPTHYILGIACALLFGTILGKLLFPTPEPIALQGDTNSGNENAGPVSALLAGGEGAGLPGAMFESLLAGRASANPGRAEFEMSLRLRALSDEEVVALAERLAAGEFALTQYESYFLTGVWSRFAAIDQQAAYLAAGKLETRIMRQAASRVAARAWALADPPGALAAFIKAESENPHAEISSLGPALQVLVESDPESAIRAIEEHDGAQWFSRARGSLFQSWSKLDKKAARDWLLGEMQEKPSDTRTIIMDLSKEDPAGALEIALGMKPDGPLRHTISQIIGGHWRWQDREGAIAALKNLPTEWHSSQLAREFGMNGVTKLPIDQIDEYAAMFPDGELRNAFWITAIGRRASDAKFDDATALLNKLDPGKERASGTAEVAAAWGKVNPKQASEWLASLGPGLVRDQAVGAFANTIASIDPESARRWAESIGDDARRARALEKLGAP